MSAFAGVANANANVTTIATPKSTAATLFVANALLIVCIDFVNRTGVPARPADESFRQRFVYVCVPQRMLRQLIIMLAPELASNLLNSVELAAIGDVVSVVTGISEMHVS